MRKRFLWLVLLTASCGLLALACQPTGSGGGGGSSSHAKSGTTLAKVGSEVITLEEFSDKLDKIPPFYKRRVASKKGKMEYLDRLVNEELFYQEALSKGLDKDPEYLDQIESIKKSILAGKVKKDLMEERQEVSDEEARKEYENNPDDYQTPETVTVRHILFRLRRGDSEDKEAEVKANAEKVYNEITSGKISFEEAAKKYSDDKGSAKKGGKLPPIRKGLKSPEFDEAAFGMAKAGEVAKPFKDRRGYNILQFEEKTDAEKKEYDKVERQIKRKLAQQTQKNAMDSFVEEMRKKYPVEIKDDLLTDEEGAEDAPDVPGLMKMPGAVSGGDDDAAAGPGIKVKVEPSEEKESE